MFLSHLFIAGCDIGVQISVRPSVRSSVCPSTFTSKFGFLAESLKPCIVDFWLKKVLLPPPLGNFADIVYLKELSFLIQMRDVCTLYAGA